MAEPLLDGAQIDAAQSDHVANAARNWCSQKFSGLSLARFAALRRLSERLLKIGLELDHLTSK